MSKAKYAEGEIYAVPLRSAGYGLVAVARKRLGGGIALGYIFGRRFDSAPALDEIGILTAKDSIKVIRFGDRSIVRGEWPLVAALPEWNRADWPFSFFVRRDEIMKVAWLVEYTDDDPCRIVREEKIPYPGDFERDSMWGSGAVEIMLTKALGKQSSN